jgi:hypothetical protein
MYFMGSCTKISNNREFGIFIRMGGNLQQTGKDVYEIQDYSRAFVCKHAPDDNINDNYCLIAKKGQIVILRKAQYYILYTGQYEEVPDAVAFNYNIDMRDRGRVDLAVDFDTLDVYFTVTSHDDVTGLAGPVLLGKFTDLSQDPSVY